MLPLIGERPRREDYINIPIMKYKSDFLHNHRDMEKCLPGLNEPHDHVIVDRGDWEQFNRDNRDSLDKQDRNPEEQQKLIDTYKIKAEEILIEFGPEGAYYISNHLIKITNRDMGGPSALFHFNGSQ